ncbi:5'-methylthioadenosine/S-adenosylhomocysteine nucleosidase [Williamsoniiplasma luminosum]|uniref:adenosylhomocysteine nucleosidase n=1 Tax=Williamsoniiplasma luminosum TaxID=214888 RepID=A0A2S0NJB4_9MOLU|nr:5'-methylthioadenosine/S-adenosylhomocysteine nucleosidase [Williamsoniiplasma luminosum]AVP49104.1 MAG: 5'-methylthioadenosine/S-adenosylhomocysteine nucleosidase [Williamsoniiplasma luminosum]
MRIIIGAMFEELEMIINSRKLIPVLNSVFKEFKTEDKKLVVSVSGIGTVNASACLSYLLTKYHHVEEIINIGTSGAICESLKQGDVVIVDKASYPTTNVTSFGYQHGQVPKMPVYFESDKNLIDQTINKFKQKNQEFKIVNAATMDVFVDNQTIVDNVISQLPFNAQIVEMETAAYMQVAHLFNIPFISIKIISDLVASDHKSTLEFDDFLPQAAKKINDLI